MSAAVAAAPVKAPIAASGLQRGGLRLQRQCGCGASHAPQALRCPVCGRGNSPVLQRRASGAAPVAPVAAPLVPAGPGRPIDSALRQRMQSGFGHDFSHVRVHTDPAAARSAQALAADAYTVGRDIVFAAGRYAPHTAQGARLLAHELAHTVQQSGSPASAAAPSSLAVDPPGSALEVQADAAADQVMALPAQPRGAAQRLRHGAGLRVQRQPAQGGSAVHGGANAVNRAVADGVPYEKWAPSVEALYRRAGDPRADAVARCRTEGAPACAWLLTPTEVDRLLALAQSSGGDEAKLRAGLAVHQVVSFCETPASAAPIVAPIGEITAAARSGRPYYGRYFRIASVVRGPA